MTDLQMDITMRFRMWLKWMDNRLDFQNLNEDHFQNEISDLLANELWIPPLVFANNDEGEVIKYESSPSVIMLIRNGGHAQSPLTQWDEAKVYRSNETQIVLKTVHLMTLNCQFDLYYFPFDDQTCYVQVILCSLQESFFYQPRWSGFTLSPPSGDIYNF